MHQVGDEPNLKCVKSFQQQIPFYGTHDPICVKINATDIHIMLLGICKFRENKGRGIPSFLTGLNYMYALRVSGRTKKF